MPLLDKDQSNMNQSPITADSKLSAQAIEEVLEPYKRLTGLKTMKPLSKDQLKSLFCQTAQMKENGGMSSISTDQLVLLLKLLERSIANGINKQVCPFDEGENAENRQLEEITVAVDSALTVAYILTSENMPREIYFCSVVNTIVTLVQDQLQKTIYPFQDPTYHLVVAKAESNKENAGSARRPSSKKSRGAKIKVNKNFLLLSHKLNELVVLIGDYVDVHNVADSTQFLIVSVAVSAYFVDGVKTIQDSALKVLLSIYRKYDCHRSIMSTIVEALLRLPPNKRNQRAYRVGPDEQIMTASYLLMTVVQSSVSLSEELDYSKMNARTLIVEQNYDRAAAAATSFISVLLNKLTSRSDEKDYRTMLESFVHDLVATLNKPEWPAAEMILNKLGCTMVTQAFNKSKDLTSRLLFVEAIGTLATRLRKAECTNEGREGVMERIIGKVMANRGEPVTVKKSKKMRMETGAMLQSKEEEKQYLIQALQGMLLDSLASGGAATDGVRHFRISQWYRDEVLKTGAAAAQVTNATELKKEDPQPSKKIGKASKRARAKSTEPKSLEARASMEERMVEKQKQFLLRKIKSSQGRVDMSIDDMQIVTRYLINSRPCFKNFTWYLGQILHAFKDPVIQIRAKAVRCIRTISESDHTVLLRLSIQSEIQRSAVDKSAAVREAAIDLIGKIVPSRTELLNVYYNVLVARVVDSSLCVKKRVIKILKDVCAESPDFPKIPEYCVNVISHVCDEEAVQRLVVDTFEAMWFVPLPDGKGVDNRVANITDVVLALGRTIGQASFENLLTMILNPRTTHTDAKLTIDPPPSTFAACDQIVDCLLGKVQRSAVSALTAGRRVGYFGTLYQFAKVRPQLLAPHSLDLHTHLVNTTQALEEVPIIKSVAQILELTLPLLNDPDPDLLSLVEQACVSISVSHEVTVVGSCISCLAVVVERTGHYHLVGDLFNRFYLFMKHIISKHRSAPHTFDMNKYGSPMRKSLYVIAMMLRVFDVNQPQIKCYVPEENIVNKCLALMTYLLTHVSTLDVQCYAIKAVGQICVRHKEVMMAPDVKRLYSDRLSLVTSDCMKIEVLHNVELFLVEDEKQTEQRAKQWAAESACENLKEMRDVASGMASTVVQMHLHQILPAYLNVELHVRQAAASLIHLIVHQGLVNVAELMPYLICMSTDPSPAVSLRTAKELTAVCARHPAYLPMKVVEGVKLSYRLQSLVQANTGEGVVRGFTSKGEEGTAMLGHVYSLLRSCKAKRRGLALSMLKMFDEMVHTPLAQLIYLADNLAYFFYMVVDEVMFIIYHIEVISCVSGTNVLEDFDEALIPREQLETDMDSDSDARTRMLNRLPEDKSVLKGCIASSQGCKLLLMLKQHLKLLYGITDSKMSTYNPTDVSTAKANERNVSRRPKALFSPTTTITALRQSLGAEQHELEPEALVEEYFDFKEIMLELDPLDPETVYRADHAVIAMTRNIQNNLANLQKKGGVTDNKTKEKSSKKRRPAPDQRKSSSAANQPTERSSTRRAKKH